MHKLGLARGQTSQSKPIFSLVRMHTLGLARGVALGPPPECETEIKTGSLTNSLAMRFISVGHVADHMHT